METGTGGISEKRREGAWASGVLILFYLISYLSRLIPVLFFLVIGFGIGFPLIWAWRKDSWISLGFSRANLGPALKWGLAAGLAWSLYTLIVFGVKSPLPTLYGLQIAVGIPVWFLILAPFQEFLFRGWMQPKLQAALGIWTGWLGTSLAFTLWHVFPPFEGTATSTLAITTPAGTLSTLALGLLMGYIFQRTGNILAPWLAHAFAGIALVATGMMTFIQYTM